MNLESETVNFEQVKKTEELVDRKEVNPPNEDLVIRLDAENKSSTLVIHSKDVHKFIQMIYNQCLDNNIKAILNSVPIN